VTNSTSQATTSQTRPRPLARAAALTAALALTAIAALTTATPATAQTTPGAPTTPGDPTRAYELVSPPYKISGNGAGNPSIGPGRAVGVGSGAYTAERFAVSGHLGAMLLDAPFATASDWALAQRIDDQTGWQSHSPVTHPFQVSENYRMLFMQAAAPDFSTMLWAGNAGDLPFFEEMGALGTASAGSSLVSDWGNPPGSPPRWEPIGPLQVAQRLPGTTGEYVFVAPTTSADGSHLAVSGPVRGLAGDLDPTLDTLGPEAHSAYIDDISAGLSDSWPGGGIRIPAAACTGQDGGPGQLRTRIPVRNADGSLGEAICAPPQTSPMRASRLVSDYGSMITWQRDSNTIGTSNTNVISTDGSRTFFMAPDPSLNSGDNPGATTCVDSSAATKCPAQLYVRQRNADGEVVTRWISRPEAGRFGGPGQAALLGTAYFEGASADGSKVFFRTNSPLTADDPNGEFQTPANLNPTTARGARSWDLYMFELSPGPDGNPATADGDPIGPGSKLTRITAGPTGTADCSTQPNVVAAAALRFSSQDGDRVYFSCSAPLGGVGDRATGTAAGTQGGTPTTADQTNVYLYDSNASSAAGRYRFIARIPRTTATSPATNENLTRCASAAALRGASLLENRENLTFATSALNCWRGTDDGAFATFWTLGRLTANDPDEFELDPSADIYAYDAETDELVRISAPQGSVDETYPCGGEGAAETTDCYANPGQQAGIFQSAPNPLLGVATDPVIAGDRVAFFESRSQLVDADTDDKYDVYEWHNGELKLITPPSASPDGAFFKGNSADGNNVYFATSDQLTWQDVDAVLDVYTARTDGGIAVPSPSPACAVLADGCQAAGSAPALRPDSRTSAPAPGSDVSLGVRRRVGIVRPGTRARRRAARTGVLAVGVRVSQPGVVRLGARARMGGKSVRIAGVRKRVAKAGRKVFRLRLNGRARKVLAGGRKLRLTLRVAQAGALSRSATVSLERGDR
jgi:hypothetical protein